jgi:tetratricopeptide (TPR) repeat protein
MQPEGRRAAMNGLRFWVIGWVIGMAGVAAAGAQPALSKTALSPTELADLNELGNQAADRGDFTGAEPSYQQAVEQFRAMGPGYEAHLAASLVNLAAAACGQGRRAEGAQYFEEALVLHRRTLGPKHLRTVININRAATNYLMLGDQERAQSLFGEALAIERELYPNDGQLAQTLGGLVVARLRMRQMAEALPMAEEALEIARKTSGDGSVEAAQMYASVAEVHRVSGRLDRALPLYRKARFIYETALGKEDTRAASILSQEGLILVDEGKLTLAGQTLERAVNMLRLSCPSCVPELSTAENNLGVLRLKQKRYAEADQLLTHVLALQEKYLAKPGRETADTLQNLAVVREKEQFHEDAVRLRNQATVLLSYR